MVERNDVHTLTKCAVQSASTQQGACVASLCVVLWHHSEIVRPLSPAVLLIQDPGTELKAVTNFTQFAGMDSAHGVVDASVENALPRRPNGYILSHGVSYKAVPSEGTALEQLPACPPSATACGARPHSSQLIGNA